MTDFIRPMQGCDASGSDVYGGDDIYHGGVHEYESGICEAKPPCREATIPVQMPKPEERVDTTAPRASVLNEARNLITGDRNNQYGPPTQDFARTAALLNALGYCRTDADGETIHPIAPSDVAIMVAQVKVSRLMHSRNKRDSWVDLAGYAACGYECAAEEANE